MWAHRPSSASGTATATAAVPLKAPLKGFEDCLGSLEELTGFSLQAWRKERRPEVTRSRSRVPSARGASGRVAAAAGADGALAGPASVVADPSPQPAAAAASDAAADAELAGLGLPLGGGPGEESVPAGGVEGPADEAPRGARGPSDSPGAPKAAGSQAKTPAGKGARGGTPQPQQPARVSPGPGPTAEHREVRHVQRRARALPKLRPASGARRIPMASRDALSAWAASSPLGGRASPSARSPAGPALGGSSSPGPLPSPLRAASPPLDRRSSASGPHLRFDVPAEGHPSPSTSRRNSVSLSARRRSSGSAGGEAVLLEPVAGLSHSASTPAVTSSGILPPSALTRVGRAHDPAAAAAAAAGTFSSAFPLHPALAPFALDDVEFDVPPAGPPGGKPPTPRSVGGTSMFNRIHVFTAHHPVTVTALDAVFNLHSGMSEGGAFTKNARIKLLRPKGTGPRRPGADGGPLPASRPQTSEAAARPGHAAGLPARPSTSALSFRLRSRLHPGEPPPPPPPPRPFVVSASSSINDLIFTRPRYAAIR
eukprot:tig00000754_g3907.t1